jgi:C-terminal processing protease CtpA/Prc
MVVDVWDPELKQSGLTPGAEVLSINGLPARQYAENFVVPYQSASTPQDLATRTYEYFLFSGPISETLKVEFETPKGKKISAVVRRKNAEQRKALLPKPTPFEFRMLPGNIAYVALNAFDDMTAADEYIKAFAEISKSDAMIIDVRANGGGSSGVGYRVLATLVNQPFLGSRWATRDYKPSFRAWGRPDRMYSPEPERYPNDTEHRYEKPVIVLSSGRTYSAAEDFLVAFDTSKRGTIIGEPSGGSTGQPLFFKLPGGGSARVCSKKDTYADGKPFVGSGIQPQIVVHPKVADFRTGKDTVLDAAIIELQKTLAQK